MKKTFNFSVHPPDHYDKVLNDLANANLHNEDYNLIYEKINKLFGGSMIEMITLKQNRPDLFVYRITNFEPPPNENQFIKHYSFPPNPLIGRANLKGVPVFYCSLSPLTAITEMKDLTDCDYYISKWRLKFKTALRMAVITSNGNSNPKTIVGQISKNIITARYKRITGIENEQARIWLNYKLEKFNDLFTIKGKEHYHLSSAIAHKYLYDFEKQGFPISILMYPSITRNKEDANFAISKDIAENTEYLSLMSVLKCHIIKKKENEFKANFNKKGFNIRNSIEWTNGTLELESVDFEKIQLVFYEAYQDNKEYYDSHKINITCGQDNSNLSDFITKNYLTDIQNSLQVQYDGCFAENNYLNNRRTYIHTIRLVLEIPPGLIAHMKEDRQIGFIILNVDILQKFQKKLKIL